MRVRSFHYAVAVVLSGIALIPLLGQNPLGGLKQAVQKAKQVVTPPAKQQTPAPTQQPTAQQPAAAQQPAGQPAAQVAPSAAGAAPAAQAASVAQPPMAGTIPMTRMAYALLTMRDLPKQFFDDSHLINFAFSQIANEQSLWKQLGPDPNTGRIRPSITFEWQKLIDQQPDLAGGALLDVFMKSDPDWSFLNSNPKWDPNAAPNLRPSVVVFLFSKEKVEGRQAEFAARELFPVVKRQFELALKKLPTHFYFTEQLPSWKYDFDAKGIKFEGTQAMPNKINLLMPQYDPEAKTGSREYFIQLPAKAQTLASYQFRGGTPGYSVTQDTLPTETNPGVPLSFSTVAAWHKAFSESKIPEPSILALDRQVQLTTIPVDIARAEALTKLGGYLTARVYFAADHIELHHEVAGKEFTAATPTLLYAQLEKVEILSKDGALVAAYDPQSFTVASAPAAAPAPVAAKAAPPAAPTGETNEQRVARENREMNAKMQAEFNEKTKKNNCDFRASRTKGGSDPNSAVYKNAYDACMKEK